MKSPCNMSLTGLHSAASSVQNLWLVSGSCYVVFRADMRAKIFGKICFFFSLHLTSVKYSKKKSSLENQDPMDYYKPLAVFQFGAHAVTFFPLK